MVHVDFDIGEHNKLPWLQVDPDYLAARRPRQNRILDQAPEGVENYLHALVSAFAAMEIADIEILHGLLNGMRCSEIATAFGYRNRAAVHARLKAAFARNPWLEDMYMFGHNVGGIQTVRRSGTWKGWNGKPMRRGQGKGFGTLASTLPGVSASELKRAKL